MRRWNPSRYLLYLLLPWTADLDTQVPWLDVRGVVAHEKLVEYRHQRCGHGGIMTLPFTRSMVGR